MSVINIDQGYEIKNSYFNKFDDDVKKYLTGALSKSTMKSYLYDWEHFKRFINQYGYNTHQLDENIICRYIMSNEGKIRPTTMKRRITAMRKILAYLDQPTFKDSEAVKDALSSFSNNASDNGYKVKQAKPCMITDLMKAVSNIEGNLNKDIRDKSVLTLLHAGGFRRSEIVNLKVEDLIFDNEGVLIKLWNTKTSKSGFSQDVYLHRYKKFASVCPVHHLQNWLKVRNSEGVSNYVFQSISRGNNCLNKVKKNDSNSFDNCTVHNIIKKHLGNLDQCFQTHSMRRGIATHYYDVMNVPVQQISTYLRHKSIDVTLGYVERSDTKRNSPSINM